MSITEGSKGSQLLANIPGMNSGTVFHDVLVGTVERGLNIHTLSTTTKSLAGLFTNQMTIVPAIGLNYAALGANSYDYYTDQLAQGAN